MFSQAARSLIVKVQPDSQREENLLFQNQSVLSPSDFRRLGYVDLKIVDLMGKTVT
jgi:hypothetical protein